MIADDLARRSDALRQEVTELRERADRLTVDASRLRHEADQLELEAVEAMTAANMLRQIGLHVDRSAEGYPRVTVDQPIAMHEVTQ